VYYQKVVATRYFNALINKLQQKVSWFWFYYPFVNLWLSKCLYWVVIIILQDELRNVFFISS
jgi:hypothetical protein